MQCLWIKWLSIIKMPFDPKLMFRFTAFSIKYQHGFRGSCQAVLKFMTKIKSSKLSILLKKITYLGEGGSYAQPLIKIYKLIIINKIWQSYWHRGMELGFNETE